MFNGVFSTVFNVDASVQAFAADLNFSDISSNDDFIQYPDQTDNQTYQNAILHNKSIPVSFAIEEDEAQQRVDSNSELVNTAAQSGTLASGEQAETVVTSQGLLAEGFPEPEMDRPWFCAAYAAAGYFMCDPITNVPKWCTYNLADIWCPDDPGYEYDGATGQGGSSGGAGASRTWDVQKCMDSEFRTVSCGEINLNCWYNLYDKPFVFSESIYNKEIDFQIKPCNQLPFFSCVDQDGIAIDCNRGTLVSRPYDEAVVSPGYSGCLQSPIGSSSLGTKSISPKECTPIQKKVDKTSPVKFQYSIGSGLVFQDPQTGLPLNNEPFENGFPIPVPPPDDPFKPEYPETTDECASIICQCISFVVKALEKVDQSILQVVAAVQALSFEVPTPAPFDISPVTDRLDDILTAVDNISFEMVKEAETNIWDFLGETISTLNDLIQYLIDQIIYLIVPEDTDFLRENFSMLREAMSMKLEPVNMLKTQITASLMTEQKNFEDIEMDLPIYGRVEFLNVEFLNYAVPKIRALISGIMIIVTSVWAYRKITSDMVR